VNAATNCTANKIEQLLIIRELQVAMVTQGEKAATEDIEITEEEKMKDAR
jgi:hypothetical protein